MSIEVLRLLQSEEDAVQFIAEHIGLPYQHVKRIYRAGQPWPVFGEAWDFGRQAAKARMDLISYMAAMTPLVEMTVEARQAKRKDDDQDVEFAASNPAVVEHIEKVANLTNETTEVV